MEAGLILGSLFGIIVVVFALISLKKYSINKFGYDAFSIVILLCMVVVSALALTGYGYLPEGDVTFTITEPLYLNSILFFSTAIAGWLAIFIRLITKTNIWLALIAITIQTALSFFALLIAILLVALIDKGRK